MDKDNKCSCTGFLAIAPILADSNFGRLYRGAREGLPIPDALA